MALSLNKFRSKKYIKGFSLVELALALVVVAVISVVAIQQFTAGKQNQVKKDALTDLQKIKQAVESYVAANGYYPCPASPLMLESDPQFAVSLRESASGNCVIDDNFGIFNAEFDANPARFEAPVNYSDTGLNAVFDADIIIGAPPCKDIGLPANCMFDPQGNRYAYAVIPELARMQACRNYVMAEADRAQDQQPEGIKMLKEVDLNLNLKDNHSSYGYSPNPDYAVIYYGPDGYGAFPNYGGAVVQRITPTQVGGNNVGDNTYQEINHDLYNGFDEYFFSPENPLSSQFTFGDILVFGKRAELDTKYCVSCDDICSYGIVGVVTVDNFTGCNTAVQNMCSGL